MQIIATNVRFNKIEYEDLKKLALSHKKSVASLIRDAVTYYKEKKLSTKEDRKNLYELIVRSAVQINTPVVKLVQEGRRFE